MIIVDFSHLAMRNLFISIKLAEPKKNKETKKYITEDYINLFKKMVITSVINIYENFRSEYGNEIVLAIDDSNYWRKDYFEPYKGHRKATRDNSEIDFKEYREELMSLISELREYFPFKVVRSHRAEADDVIAVLTEYNQKKGFKTLIVSSDKDFKQLLKYPDVKIYDPIKKEYMEMDEIGLDLWREQHILLGDKADNIPHIKVKTQFSENFLNYLKQNGINLKKEDVLKFLELPNRKELIDNYTIYRVNRAGNLTDEKDVFKTIPFGEKGALKFAQNLDENLDSNPLYRKRYELNKVLVLFEFIPKYIKDKIIEDYLESSDDFSQSEMSSVFRKYSMIENIPKIHILGHNKKCVDNDKPLNEDEIDFMNLGFNEPTLQNQDDFNVKPIVKEKFKEMVDEFDFLDEPQKYTTPDTNSEAISETVNETKTPIKTEQTSKFQANGNIDEFDFLDDL